MLKYNKNEIFDIIISILLLSSVFSNYKKYLKLFSTDGAVLHKAKTALNPIHKAE